jgi:hypothetical protein
MKFIKINESQRKRLFEAYQEGFSFEDLTMIGDSAFADEDNSAAQMAYCTKWLGRPDSKGSSRAVFTLNDNMVLKLAYGEWHNAGIAQNKQECEVFQQVDSPLLTRIFYHDKNFSYIVSESVLPCYKEDFEKILGIPFYHAYVQNSTQTLDTFSKNKGDKEIGFNKYFDKLKKPFESSELSMTDIFMYIECNYVLDEPYNSIKVENAINNSQWLKDFVKLVIDTRMSDFCQTENFGIVNRNGNPTIVVLDSGLNLDVWEKNYNV